MQLPGFTQSAETLQETYGVCHLTRLKADKNQADLATDFIKAQDRLKVRIEAHKAAAAGAMTAMAVRDGEDAALDDVVRAFALAVLAKVGNSRKSPLYLKYFPKGLNAVVSAPLEAEVQRVGVILSLLAEEEDEGLKPHAGSLSAAMGALVAAMDAHRAALDAEVQTYGLLQTEKVNWLDAYKRSYRELTRQFFKSPKKADTYFKPAKASARTKKGNGEEPQAPAAGN